MSNTFYLPDHPKQPLYYSLWQQIVNKSDAGQAERVLYRAWKAKPRSLTGWIKRGLKDGYAFKSCRDEYDNPKKVQDWIKQYLRRENLPTVEPEYKTSNIKNLVADVAAKMGVK